MQIQQKSFQVFGNPTINFPITCHVICYHLISSFLFLLFRAWFVATTRSSVALFDMKSNAFPRRLRARLQVVNRDSLSPNELREHGDVFLHTILQGCAFRRMESDFYCPILTEQWSLQLYGTVQTFLCCFEGRVHYICPIKRQADCYKHNTEVCSCNHCCSKKATNIPYSDVCVCSLWYPACNVHASYLYCHLWPVWLYSTFTRYKEQDFRKE